LFALISAVSFFGGAVAAAQLPPAPAPISIRVDPGTVTGPIAKDFVGFGYETSAVAQEGFFSEKNKVMVQLYRTLSPCGLIRIGGNISDWTKFEANGTLLATTQGNVTVINQRVLDDLGGFLRATGWKAMWGLNLGTGSKEEAVEEALAVHRALGDRLHSFQIGNEVELLKRFKEAGYGGYFAEYGAFKSAIRQALPGAVFSGPDACGSMKYVEQFASTEFKDISCLTIHYYCSGAGNPRSTVEFMLAPVHNWESTLGKLRGISREKRVPYRINEVNSFYGGGKPGVSDTFASALWCLDYMFLLASYGCGGVNMQTDINQLGFVSHYSPIYKDKDGRVSPRPEYYGMLAFALAGQGELVKLTAGETPINLRAYATKSAEGHSWVTLVNKDLAQEVRINLTLPAGCTTAEAYRLTAPSADSKTGVTLAGTAVSSEGTWTPRVTEKLAVADNAVSFALPAASALLVRLR
jgi:hypothetical protein